MHERTLALVLFVITLPVMLVSAALIVCIDRQSPVFVQKRVGQDGSCFDLFKLKTMRDIELPRSARAEFAARQKLTSDPRCTKVGKWLRKLSIDELPQLLNVVLGDMALIGPRPVMLSQEASYYGMKPGITGLTQSLYRNRIPFVSRRHLEKFYAVHKSTSLDIYIVMMTLKSTILKPNGE